MTAGRVVGIVTGTPTGDLSGELVAAMLSDVIDLVAETDQVTAAILASAQHRDLARDHAWPGTPIVIVSAGLHLAALVDAVPAGDAEAVAVVAADAPDLPNLLIGKLFSGVAGTRGPGVALCPARGGGLVGAAVRLPAPDWLAASRVGLDDAGAVEAVTAIAPRGAVRVVAGWHRIRSRADTAALDPGLDGWDATRAALNR